MAYYIEMRCATIGGSYIVRGLNPMVRTLPHKCIIQVQLVVSVHLVLSQSLTIRMWYLQQRVKSKEGLLSSFMNAARILPGQ